MIDLQNLLSVARLASTEASKAIMEIYESGNFEIDAKADNSPLTLADRKSHEVIESFLLQTNIPILSEEGLQISYPERKLWEYLWIVDPLDGTKEFLKQNGEFTVNIALIKDGEPILGVVEAPILKKQFFGAESLGAFVKNKGVTTQLKSIDKVDLEKKCIKVVASRSHLNQETESFINQLSNPEIVSMGSSLKFMLVAEKKADIYPRFAPTMEWDTAAAHAIIKSLNGNVVDSNNSPLLYNKENLFNPFFKVF